MNKTIIVAAMLFAWCVPLIAMEQEDEDYEIVFFDAPRFSRNPARVFNSDLCMRVADHLSQYDLPMNAQLFESEEMQRKFQSINDVLWPNHLRITLTRDANAITATLNRVQTSAINSGEEEMLPFHQIKIPVGENILDAAYNRKLIEKRLQHMKNLALDFKSTNDGSFEQALLNYRTSVTFSDKMKFQLQHRIKPRIESDLAHHIKDTLVLPFVKIIRNTLGSNPTEAQEHELELLDEKLKADEPHLQRILYLKNKQDRIIDLQEQNLKDIPEIESTEEDFINHFERTTALFAKQDTV